jgi:hypothetical protein
VVEVLLERSEALELAGDELAHRDPGAGGHDGGDVRLADDRLAGLAGVGGRAGCLGVVGVAGRVQGREPRVQLVGTDLQLGRALVLLGHDRGVLLGVELGELLAQRVDSARGGAAAQAHLRGGLVDEVDRLVGQLVLGDVAVREPGRGDEGGIGDARLVVTLVRLAQAAQDLDGVLHRRLLDGDRREAPRERAVALDLAVLGERRRPDHPQLTAGEHGLEHVRGVHRALGVAGAEDRVQLVEEQQDAALGLRDLVERLLEALLELTAVLRARNHAGEVERDDAGARQRRGHVALDDAPGQTLDDRGLADAGLADEDGVVLPAAGEDLDGLLDLLLAADHRVDAALAGLAGEVAPELVERGGLAVVLLLPGARSALHGSHRGALGHELTGAPLAQRDLARPALRRDDRAHGAGPLSAYRADGDAVAREALGDVCHLGLLSR